MTDNGRYNSMHILLAFLTGAAAGAVVGLLTAPTPGRDAREVVRGWSRDVGERAARATTRAARAAREAFNESLQAQEPGGPGA